MIVKFDSNGGHRLTMTMQDIIDEVRLALTGHVLNLEIEDSQIEAIVKKAMREVERF